MRTIRLFSSVVLFSILVLCSSGSLSQNSFIFSLTTGNETYDFVPQPQLGYVVKSSSNQSAMMLLESSLQGAQVDEEENLIVANRPEIVIVLGEQPFVQSQSNIKMLSNQPETQYIAPIYTLEGYTVAIIPEIIVRLLHKSDFDKLEDLCRELDCTIIRNLIYTEQEFLITLSVQNAEEVLTITEIFSAEDFIEWAFPNLVSQIELCSQSVTEELNRLEPNDVYFNKQWHLNTIRAPEAWYYADETGDPNIIVAVLDTGVDIDHPDLENNIWTNPREIPDNGIDDDENGRKNDVHGWDFYGNDPNVNGDSHGTKCAGLIAAQGNNETGVTGVTWNCKIMPIRFLGPVNPKTGGSSVMDTTIAAAIRYAAKSGADILSNSWDVANTPVIKSAIQDVTVEGGIGRNGKGCVVFASSGNYGGPVIYPAKYQEVIAVGAIDVNDVVWDYSCYGSALDIVAPSGCSNCETIYKFWTTDNDGDYTDTMDGTSAACPIAAGVAALILSIDPDLTNSEVRNILLHSARDLGLPGRDDDYGFGCVDAYAAVDMTLNRIEFKLFVDAKVPNDPEPGDPKEDGSFEHPFDSIQEAINKSIPGDTVIVLPGTYTGEGNYDIDYDGKVITVRSKEGPETCIIDCEMQGRGFDFHSGEGANSVLEGFTITNGQADYFGGGIRVDKASPTVTNCYFIRNSAIHGGGMYNYSSKPVLTNCTFIGNSANYGGGMYNSGGTLTLTNCTFIGNSANNSGGGLYHSSSSSDHSLTNCTFTGNSANGYGGGLCKYYGNYPLTNCTFSGNVANKGGGLYNGLGRLTLTNCILWGNIDDSGRGESGQISGTKTVVNFSCIEGWTGTLEGGNNIGAYPLFADPGYWDFNDTPNDPNDDLWFNGDYHLKSESGRWDPTSEIWIIDDVTSQGIDAGDPNSPIGHEPFPDGGIINLGAYGGTNQASKASI